MSCDVECVIFVKSTKDLFRLLEGFEYVWDEIEYVGQKAIEKEICLQKSSFYKLSYIMSNIKEKTGWKEGILLIVLIFGDTSPLEERIKNSPEIVKMLSIPPDVYSDNL